MLSGEICPVKVEDLPKKSSEKVKGSMLKELLESRSQRIKHKLAKDKTKKMIRTI